MVKITFKESEVRDVEATRKCCLEWLNVVFGGGDVEIIKDQEKDVKVEDKVCRVCVDVEAHERNAKCERCGRVVFKK